MVPVDDDEHLPQYFAQLSPTQPAYCASLHTVCPYSAQLAIWSTQLLVPVNPNNIFIKFIIIMKFNKTQTLIQPKHWRHRLKFPRIYLSSIAGHNWAITEIATVKGIIDVIKRRHKYKLTILSNQTNKR